MKASFIKSTIFDALILGYLFCLFLVAAINPTDEQLLDLKQNFTIFVFGLLLSALISVILNKLKIDTLGEILFRIKKNNDQQTEKPLLKSFWGWQLLVFFFSTLIAGLITTDASLTKLFDPDSVQPTLRLFSNLIQPNVSILPKAVLMMLETMFLAFTATVLSIPIAFVLCFFAAKNIMKSNAQFFIYTTLRTSLNILRSIESFVWAIIFTVWVGIGPFAGMLALMVHSVASLIKQYSEIVEGVEAGPIDAIKSTGANTIQTIWYAIVPQVILPFISFTIYRWDINIRMATIVGFVGGGGVGYLLQTYTSQAMWPEVGTIVLVIAFVVWLMDTASAYIREALK